MMRSRSFGVRPMSLTASPPGRRSVDKEVLDDWMGGMEVWRSQQDRGEAVAAIDRRCHLDSIVGKEGIYALCVIIEGADCPICCKVRKDGVASVECHNRRSFRLIGRR